VASPSIFPIKLIPLLGGLLHLLTLYHSGHRRVKSSQKMGTCQVEPRTRPLV
jgi:hypothetical protein